MELVADFVANREAVRSICGEIDSNRGSLIPQPIVVIGQEGAGKTTLLQRVVSKYPDLKFSWIDGRTIFCTQDIIDQVADDSILLIDNLDYYLNRCAYEEQYRLRRYLYNEGAPMMIATVSRLTRALVEYKAPFFEGLRKIHLPPISPEELSSLFDRKAMTRVERMFNLLAPTVKSVKIISGIIELNKNPETDIDSLVSLFSDRYKLNYRSLPTISQHILNIIAQKETGMTIPEIRDKSNVASGILTSYIKHLKKRDIVSLDKTFKRKTKYYIKDPLFRVWLM